jgi:hypothetical protein
MANRVLLRLITITGIVTFYQHSQSQELNTSAQQYLEDRQESAAEESNAEMDISTLTDDLIYFLQHPLNLNTASRDDLYKLQILTDFQVESLIDYREKNGFLKSVYELQYVPGYTKEEMENLEPYITCKPEVQKFRIDSSLFRKVDNELFIRWQRIPEKQFGYQKIADSILQNEPDKSRYLGNADKLYIRYRISMKNRIKGALLAEKDAGEEFFKGSNSQGFDFYSAYLLYSNPHSLFQSIVIGDYHIQIGQGLLAWSSFSLGKSCYISNICQRSSTLNGNISAEENRFLRGAAFTIGRKKVYFTVFGSKNKIDASYSDSIPEDSFFNGFTETGNHNTPAELKKENYLSIITYGAIVRFEGNKLKIGLNGIHTSLDKSPLPGNELYKAYSYSGQGLTGYSADYHYLAGTTQLFGETAFSNKGIASLNGLIFFLKPEVNFAVVYHYYQPQYFSYFSNAFSESSNVSNENGFFLTGEFHFSGYRIKMYGDVFSFPWLKYRVNAPSDGHEIYFETGKKIKRSDLYFRFRLQVKPIDDISGGNLNELKSFDRSIYRMNFIFPLGENAIMQSRIEISRTGYHGQLKNNGYLIFQDITLNNTSRSNAFSLRVAYFNVSNYNSRLYAYEKDILYANSTQMFYGKGWHVTGMFKWQPKKYVTLWFRISHTIFPGEVTTGSGLDEINGNHKTEVKVQLLFRF